MALLTTDQNFAIKYDKQGLQPSYGTRGAQPMQKSSSNGVRNVQVAKRATGTGVQATGVSMQFAGRGVKNAGKGMTRIGAGLSSTGIGAIVGVPLMAVGGVATGAGTGMQVAGKQVSRSGRRMQKSAGGKQATISREGIKNLSAHMKALQAGFFFALPVAFLTIFEMAFFVAASALAAVGEGVAQVVEADNPASNLLEFVVDGATYLAGSAADAVKQASGGLLDIGAVLTTITDTLNPGTYFVAFWGIGIMFGFITLLSVGAVYQFSGVNPIFGKGSGAKVGGFLIALVMYCVPMAHMFPWFIIWMWAIKEGEK